MEEDFDGPKIINEKDWVFQEVNENDKITAKNIAKEILEETKNIDSIRWEKLKQNSYSIALISFVIIVATGSIFFSLTLLDEKIMSLEDNQKDIVIKIDNIQVRLVDKIHVVENYSIENSYKIDQILTLMENNDKK